MTTVFLSGSRKISRINDAIRSRIDNMIAKHHAIMIGDANGADKAMQSYLAELAYQAVTVYCAGAHCRNNVGRWRARNVAVAKNVTGRDFYVQKDKEMARLADFGFVLWDGKSAGSVGNMMELLKSGKKAVVYYGPEKRFYNVGAAEDLRALLDKCDPETFDAINKKLGLASSLPDLHDSRQATLALL